MKPKTKEEWEEVKKKELALFSKLVKEGRAKYPDFRSWYVESTGL